MKRPDFIKLQRVVDMQLRHNFASDDVSVIIFANSVASVTTIAAVICSAASALKSDSAFR